jgi:hypothetical protein
MLSPIELMKPIDWYMHTHIHAETHTHIHAETHTHTHVM